jgi:hypothetical protein
MVSPLTSTADVGFLSTGVLRESSLFFKIAENQSPASVIAV